MSRVMATSICLWTIKKGNNSLNTEGG